MNNSGLILLTTALLTACGGGSSKTAKNMDPHGDYDLQEETDDARIVNEVIADDDDFKVVVISVKHTDISITQGENQAKIYFENKTDREISLGMTDVFVDGVEMDEYDFYNVLDANEIDTEILRTFDFDGDLPEMEDSLSFILTVSDYETHDTLSTYEVNLDF